MTEIKHYCDKCNELLLNGRTKMVLKTGLERLRRPEIDLCDEHMREFVNWLDDRPAGCTAGTPRASKTDRLAAR